MCSGLVDANTLERWGGDEEDGDEGNEFDFSDLDYLRNPIHKYDVILALCKKIMKLKDTQGIQTMLIMIKDYR